MNHPGWAALFANGESWMARVAPGPAPGAQHLVTRTTPAAATLGVKPARAGGAADASTGSGARGPGAAAFMNYQG